jgi:hypothetical protein
VRNKSARRCRAFRAECTFRVSLEISLQRAGILFVDCVPLNSLDRFSGGLSAITGTKANLPGYAFFSAGTDVGLSRRFTVAVDYIGQELINAPRVAVVTFTSQAPLVSTGQIGSFATASPIANQTYNQSNLAVGLKANVLDRFVVSSNLLIALNDGGLREKVVPLIGLSYTF